MAHEVIMPALGMAQETGVLVAWLKQPGDKVRAGEALMEVETDKSVMEVEAQVEGWLTDLRAAAGDTVPVGQTIALIVAEKPQAGAPGLQAPAPAAAAAQAPVAAPVAAPAEVAMPADARQVIMPALGMTQQTGRVVAWHKAFGDAVAAGDVLLEVETDKSTVELNAGHDGFVAAILAEPGQDVPVGDVIAIITAAKLQAPLQGPAAASAPTQPTPVPVQPPVQPPQPHPAAPAAIPAAQGRILASPKARRLAREQGLDLSRLAATGHPQPFHVADLDVLRDLPEAAPPASQAAQTAAHAAASGAAMTAASHQITARIATAGVTEFLDRMQRDGGIELPQAALWASFAASALRAATGSADQDIVVEVAPLGGPARRLANPDRMRLSAQAEDDSDRPATLILRDLTQTPIATMRTGAGACPVLGIGTDGDGHAVTLDYAPDQLSEGVAIAFMTGLARRLAEPLLYLV